MRPKIYLLPGTMCNEQLWSKLVPLLQDKFDLIHLPLPANKNIKQLAQHFAGILSDQVNVLGFSLGGYIAAFFAKYYPHKVNNLFVVSNNLSQLPEREVMQRKQTINWIREHGYKGVSSQKAAQLLDKKNRNEKLITLIKAMDKAMGEEEFISQNTYTTEREDLLLNSPDFACPTRLFYSEDDPLMQCHWLDAPATTAASAIRIRTVSGSGHFLPLEQPERLAQEITKWMSEVPAPLYK